MTNNLIKFVTISIAVVLVASALVVFSNSEDTESENTEEINTPANVLIMNGPIDDYSVFKNIQMGQILQINFIPVDNVQQFYDELIDLVQRGIPVIAEGSELFASDYFDISKSVAYDALLTGMYFDPITGNGGGYGVSGMDMNEGLYMMYSWANECIIMSGKIVTVHVPDYSVFEDIQMGQILKVTRGTSGGGDIQQFYDELIKLLQRGIPVIAEGSELFMSDYFDVDKSVMHDALLTGMYINPITGKTSSYGVSGMDLNKAQSTMYAWANGCIVFGEVTI